MSFTPDSAAPTGRNKPAQGKEAAKAADAALGGDVQNTLSPEGAKEWSNYRAQLSVSCPK